MKQLALCALVSVVFGACNTYDVLALGSVDAASRTVTARPGASGVMGRIKQGLRKEGWKVLVGPGQTVTVGSISGDQIKSESGNSRTRYQLVGDFQRFDTDLLTFQGMYAYEVVLVDLATGEEVVTMTGSGVANTIADRFVAAVVANTK